MLQGHCLSARAKPKSSVCFLHQCKIIIEKYLVYQNKIIQLDESISSPDTAISETGKWEIEWHVLYALCSYNFSLWNPHKKLSFFNIFFFWIKPADLGWGDGKTYHNGEWWSIHDNVEDIADNSHKKWPAFMGVKSHHCNYSYYQHKNHFPRKSNGHLLLQIDKKIRNFYQMSELSLLVIINIYIYIYPSLVLMVVVTEYWQIYELHHKANGVDGDDESAFRMNKWKTIKHPKHAIHTCCDSDICEGLKLLHWFPLYYLPKSWTVKTI